MCVCVCFYREGSVFMRCVRAAARHTVGSTVFHVQVYIDSYRCCLRVVSLDQSDCVYCV